MAQSACLGLVPTRGGSRSAVLRGGKGQPRIGYDGTVKSLPATLPCGRNESQDRKKGQPELVVPTGLAMSGRLDSNQRPPEPHSGALAKLRHAPSLPCRHGEVGCRSPAGLCYCTRSWSDCNSDLSQQPCGIGPGWGCPPPR